MTRLYSLNIDPDAERAGPKIIKLADPLAEALAPVLGSLCVFAVRGEETIDLKIKDIRYTTDLNAEIVAVNYSLPTIELPRAIMILTSTPYPVGLIEAIDANELPLIDAQAQLATSEHEYGEYTDAGHARITGATVAKVIYTDHDLPEEDAIDAGVASFAGASVGRVIYTDLDLPEEDAVDSTGAILTDASVELVGHITYDGWPSIVEEKESVNSTGALLTSCVVERP